MGPHGFARNPGFRALLILAAAAAVLGPAGGAGAGTTRDRAFPARERRHAPASTLARCSEPARLEPNLGQWDPAVRFLGRSRTCLAFLADGEAVFRVGGPVPAGGFRSRCVPLGPALPRDPGAFVRMEFVGAAPSPRIEPSGTLPSVSNYLLGNDRSRWRSGVPHRAAAAYRGLWPGVDLVFRGAGADLEYDLVLAPGADPDAIRFRFTGQEGLSIDGGGDLVLRTAGGALRQSAPLAWQEVAGARKAVASAFRILPGGAVGFETGPYDRSLPLVLDPKIDYGTYLGGSLQEQPTDVAVDSTGRILVVGITNSTNFPLQSALQGSYVGATTGTADDSYVTKYSADGQSLVFSTYLGGNGFDEVAAVAFDASDNPVLCGRTNALDFPTANAYQASNAGGFDDMFLVKLNAAGSSLTFSTYLGTTAQDEFLDVAVDSTGIYLAGLTTSPAFPLQSAVHSVFGGGVADAVVLKFNPSATTLSYSTYFGGTGADLATALAVDSTGALYVAGHTGSADFPTVGGFQTTFSGGTATTTFASGEDLFCLKLSASGASVSYASYFGGSGNEDCFSIAVDSQGEMVLAGDTSSADFPTKLPLQPSFGGGNVDAFCAKINAQGSGLVFSSIYGGSGLELTYGVGLDSGGNIYFCGLTSSTNFLVQNALYYTYKGGTTVNNDGFLVRLDPTGTQILYSTYFGSTGGDDPQAMAMDGNGSPVVVGVTESTSFPVVNPQQATNAGGSYDTYVLRIVLDPPAAPSNLAASLPGTGAVQLNWTDGSSNEDGFEVWRKTTSVPYAKIALTGFNAITYLDQNTAPSTTYTYEVRAVNGDGVSQFTNESSVLTPATVPPPVAPNALVATALSTTSVGLTWNDRSNNENLFEVQRRPLPGSYGLAANVPANNTTWQDLTLAPDTSLLYKVRAVGASAASAFTAEAAVTTPGTMALVVTKGAITDSATVSKDKVKLKGTYTYLPASPDRAIDPLKQGLTFYVGDEQSPSAVVIGPNDAGWKVTAKGAKATWKSPKSSPVKVVIALDLVKLTFSASISKTTFPAAVTNPVRVSLRVGNDAGSHRQTWTLDPKKAGVFSFKAQ